MSMEPMSAVYRVNAARERAFADESQLDHIRAMHERACAKWLELADRAEKIEPSITKHKG